MECNRLKLKEHLFFAAIILALLIIPGNLNFLHHGYMSGFQLQNWSVSYDMGFVLRGLPGTIITLFKKPITSYEAMAVNYVLLIAYAALVYIATTAAYKKDKSRYNLLFLLFILVQPPVLQRWISSSTIGRLDTFLVVAFVCTVILLIKNKNIYVRYIVANVITIISLLVHEGFAIFFVPTIFAVFLLTEKKFLKPIVFYLLPSAAAWGLTVYFGQADVPIESFMQMLNGNAKTSTVYPFKEHNIESVYYMGIVEKIKYTFDYYNETIVAKIILTFVLMSPTLYCLGGCWKSAIKSAESPKEKAMLAVLLIATVSPLIALIFATDTYRWIGWALFNNSAALVMLCFIDDKYKKTMLSYTKKHTLALIFAVVVALLLGYFTVFSPYPVIDKYFTPVYNFFFA